MSVMFIVSRISVRIVNLRNVDCVNGVPPFLRSSQGTVSPHIPPENHSESWSEDHVEEEVDGTVTDEHQLSDICDHVVPGRVTDVLVEGPAGLQSVEYDQLPNDLDYAGEIEEYEEGDNSQESCQFVFLNVLSRKFFVE